MVEGKLIHDFHRIKEWRMMRKKNKLTSPSQTFPIALKLKKKQAIKQKKQTCARMARNKADLIPSRFPSTP